MSTIIDGRLLATCGMTNVLAEMHIPGLCFELKVRVHCLVQVADFPLFQPEICAEMVLNEME